MRNSHLNNMLPQACTVLMSQAKDPRGQEILVRINTVLRSEPARVLLELKRRGIVRSNTDAICQALLVYYDRVLERDLKLLQLKNLGQGEE